MLLAFKTVEIAQIAAAVCAALAATASWSAVIVSRKVWRSGQAPRLRGSGRRSERASGAVELTMANSGRGIASEAHFYLEAAGSILKGSVSPTAFVDAAEHFSITAPLPSNSQIRGILYCVDSDDHWHVWTWDARKHRVPRTGLLRRHPRELDIRGQFKKLIGEAPPADAGELKWRRVDT